MSDPFVPRNCEECRALNARDFENIRQRLNVLELTLWGRDGDNGLRGTIKELQQSLVDFRKAYEDRRENDSKDEATWRSEIKTHQTKMTIAVSIAAFVSVTLIQAVVPYIIRLAIP